MVSQSMGCDPELGHQGFSLGSWHGLGKLVLCNNWNKLVKKTDIYIFMYMLDIKCLFHN